MVEVALEEAYQARHIRFLELWDVDGWRIKLYGIAYQAERPAEPLVLAAKEAAREHLPSPPVTTSRYGVGFLGVHQGRGFNAAFLDWWEDENELYHRFWTSPVGRPGELEPADPHGLTACVWDLAVMCHERGAWVGNVLLREDGPDVEAYLHDRIEGEV